jgi:hypothetical protein
MNETPLSPWDVLHRGQYDDAIQLFSQDYEQSQNLDLSLLRGRGMAYLAANAPRQALTDLEEVTSRTDDRFAADSDYAYLGICHWYLAHPDAAVEQWRAGLTAPYADAAGGVLLPTLLFYAGIRLGDQKLHKEAHRLLRAHWQRFVRRVKRRKDAALITPRNFADAELWNWPGAIIPFLLGQEDPAWLLNQARKTTVEILAMRQECQAQFAIAVQALQNGDRALFVSSMDACARNPEGSIESEYYLARWEMLEGYPETPFPGNGSGMEPDGEGG